MRNATETDVRWAVRTLGAKGEEFTYATLLTQLERADARAFAMQMKLDRLADEGVITRQLASTNGPLVIALS